MIKKLKSLMEMKKKNRNLLCSLDNRLLRRILDKKISLEQR